MRTIYDENDLISTVRNAINNGYVPTLEINGEIYDFSIDYMTEGRTPVAKNLIYKGKEYPASLVFIPEFGVQLVSCESLNNVLDFSDVEAQKLDEKIFFYAPDRYINDPDLGRLIWSWLR